MVHVIFHGLMVQEVCFSIFLALVIFQIEGSSPGEIGGTCPGLVHVGSALLEKARKGVKTFFVNLL